MTPDEMSIKQIIPYLKEHGQHFTCDHNSNFGQSVCERAIHFLEENETLKTFIRKFIKQYAWHIEHPDGGSVQAWAEDLGLIVPVIATEEHVDDESDFEVGDAIFTYSDILKETD